MDGNAVFILNEYRARQAQDRRDYALAIDYSRAAAAAAAQTEDNWGFCRMSYNTAELQLELGLADDCIATCNHLLATEAIKEYPDYESGAKVLITRALHDKGEMGGALAAAREASSLPVEDLSSESQLRVQHALVSALAEEGDTEAAWAEAAHLAGMLTEEGSPRDLGMGYWAVGNAAFMSGRMEEGLRYHRLAAEALTLLSDVRFWALFNKASAHMRLTAGMVEEETRECIERAEHAFAVVGVTEIDQFEMTITRAWWELECGNAGTAAGLLCRVAIETEGPYPFLQARALLMLARCLHFLEKQSEALQYARQSERILTEVGADVLASESRELIDTIQATVP